MKFSNAFRNMFSVSTAFASLMIASAAGAAPMKSAPTYSTQNNAGYENHAATDKKPKAYVSVQYYGDFFTDMGDITGHEDATGVTSGSINSLAKGSNLGSTAMGQAGYKPKYETDYMAGGISLGYAMSNGFILELEGQYANVEVDKDGYKDSAGSEKFFEITRQDVLGNAASYNPQVTTPAKDTTYGTVPLEGMLQNMNSSQSITSQWDGDLNGATVDSSTGVITNPTKLTQKNYIGPDDHLAVNFMNDGMRFIGGFVNIGYEIPISAVPISPFVVAGLGWAQTKFLGATEYGLAFQGKIGVAYNVTDAFSIFAAYDYRGTMEKEYEVTPVNKIVNVDTGKINKVAIGNTINKYIIQHPPIEEVIASTTATVKTRFGVHGLMAGVTIKF